ncbi:hypothetical protein Tco_1503276 [Tanacetum coccineum]
MGTCSSSLFANKAALILSVEAVSAAFASCVHCMFFLYVRLLSTLKKGRDLLAPFDRKRLRAAIFPLRLYTSLSVVSCSTSVMDFTFEGLACIPCLDHVISYGSIAKDIRIRPLSLAENLFFTCYGCLSYLLHSFFYFIGFVCQEYNTNPFGGVEFDGRHENGWENLDSPTFDIAVLHQ